MNVADSPTAIDAFFGCESRVGGAIAATVSVAGLLDVLVLEEASLVVLPEAFDTTTTNVDPLSEAVTAGVV